MISVPGDKSISHRALLLSALADGESRLRGVLPGADCRSTAHILRALGVSVPELPGSGEEVRVEGVGLRGLRAPDGPLDCGNSGTTARLLLGLLAGTPVEALITGDASLRERPMRRITEPLERMGARFVEEGRSGRLPIRARGGELRPLAWDSPVASAQVKSALLLAGLVGGVQVEVVEPGQSRDHTERMLRRMGADVTEGFVADRPDEDRAGYGPAWEAAALPGSRPWRVGLASPPTVLRPLDLDVPGDFSSAAFLLALGLLGGRGVRIANVGLNPTRTGLLPVLGEMGARIRVEAAREVDEASGEPAGDLAVEPGELSGVRIGGDAVPSLIDEIPILAIVAARARGVTEIRDAEELRVKESDRIRTLARNLGALGVHAEELPDGLRIHGTQDPLRGRVRANGDHRIAMAFGVLGAVPDCAVEVDDPRVVEVSFPGFWDRLAEVGRGPGAASPGNAPPRVAPAHPLVVTLDGPAGSGKSSTAREVARRLGLRHLDSGALYRALTLAVLETGIPEEEWDGLDEERLSGLDIRLEPDDHGFRILLGDRDPGEELRSSRVTSRVSTLAAIPAVRRRLLGLQRDSIGSGGVVADGRDMGTVVFPEARVKVFLTASLEERARRRLLQDGKPADPPAVKEEAGRIRTRDTEDEGRSVSPLRRPPGALEVDTTGLDFEEQVGTIVEAVLHLTGNHWSH